MKTSTDIKWVVASVPLGKHASHTLERRIQAAAANGFQGIGLVYNELLQHATSHSQSPIASARQIDAFATEHSTTILRISASKNLERNLKVALPERLTPQEQPTSPYIASEAVAFAQHNALWQNGLRREESE
ncbi:hypothetical protein P171DRAFT_488422 [Karstenula rhodostoma CBS 690.94]|uniref:Uncharacterized protein n=1 Tax=Karstenula rhodostoma CBS 690.94 TaxID=1392251 RepID=A0A9P4PBL7_9PLEO|nr:hypothetical protein P171DRAFT_488422 [Karstenula rhodostoma CBS 690.94]